MGECLVGKDVILKEKESEDKLLQLLPLKAQLGFSSLKQHFSQRGEHGIKKFLQSAKPHDTIKLEYTCIDATHNFIALGCNFGIVFFYDRHLGRLQRFIAESKQVPIVCLKILPSQNFIATGQFNGALTIFNYGKEKDGNFKILLKCTVDGHHNAPVTCIQWTPDGTKLFSGDSEGNVAISVINMDDGQTHTVFICRENSPVTQLSLCHTALLVSTLRRSLIWPFNTKMPVQVGQQERKVHGNFGACFFPDLQENVFNVLPVVYAARPGLRIWQASIEGKVSTTMIFKDSVAKGEPEISTLNLPSRNCESGPQSEPKQFGSLKVLSDSFLLSWQGSCVWVMDPKLGLMVGCHSNLGCVVDVSAYGAEMFILTKGDALFIRKVSLETQPQSPIMEISNIDFRQNETDVGIPRSGSVNQFETDKLDRIIGEMKNTTVGIISVVKRNVVKTIEQIKNFDDSEEDKSSSGDSVSSERSPSPPSTVTDKNVFSANESLENGKHTVLSRSPEVNSPCFIIASPMHDSEEDDAKVCEKEETILDSSITTTALVDDSSHLLEANDKQIDVLIKHDLKEAPIPFHHISGKAFSSDIVFEGTSRQKPKRKRKPKKALVNDDAINSSTLNNDPLDSKKAAEDSFGCETEIVQSVNQCNIPDAAINEENDREGVEYNDLEDRKISGAKDVGKSLELVSTEITPTLQSVTVDNLAEENSFENKFDEEKESFKHNFDKGDRLDNIETTEDNDIEINHVEGEGIETSAAHKHWKNHDADNDNIKESQNKEAAPIICIADSNIKQLNNTAKNDKGQDESAQFQIGVNDTSYDEELSSLSSHPGIWNVKMQKQTKESRRKARAREPCKKIDGEAVERTHVRSSSSGCIYLGQDDTINSNMCWQDEDEEKIDLDSPPHSPFCREPSLFPAPQMKYASIYSQDALSLSELSFSEPEHSVDDTVLANDQDQHAIHFDSLSVLSTYDNELTDVEDNCCHTPPINLDPSGGVELTDVMFLNRKHGFQRGNDSTRDSSCSSPSIFSLDGQMPPSPHSLAEKLSERLRLLADSWAEISVPNCGYVQLITVTDTLVWCVDSHDHIFVTPASSAAVAWKKIDGKSRQVAANQAGSIIWNVNRKKAASFRTNVKPTNPQGSDWEVVENDILEVAVDDACVWGIKTNGDVFLCTGVSPQSPYGTGRRNIRVASDLVHITCLAGMVWGLDIYNHVQIYQGDLSTLCGNEQAIQWLELPGITSSYVTLGPKGVCWIIDKDGKIWFNLELSEDNIFGGKWYELSVGEYLVQDPTVLSTVVSFFKQGNDPKILSGNDISGIWILGKHGSLHAARGHLLGTRWDLSVPIAMPSSTFWTCVSVQGSTGNGGFAWALQPNGDLHCFRPESQSFVVQPPPKSALKFINASPKSLWALTSNQDVYIRKGISETTPQGLKWTPVNMCSMGSERICNIACGVLVVWAVDYHGNVWFQMGREDTRQGVYSPAWLQVEGSPFDGCQFTKVAIGSNDCIVWAVDDKNNIYARKDVSDSFLIGTAWEIVAGTGGKDISVSDNIVWALCPNGNIVCRFGISPKNFTGDYWKTVPGCFEQLSVSADDELWGIDRQGQLYQRHTVHFFGTQATRKAPSYSQLFPTDDDWELI